LLSLFFGEMYADMTRMEQVLRQSDLDFTIMRPPQLTNGRPTAVVPNRHQQAPASSAADFACRPRRRDVAGIPDERTVRATVSLAY
jgi:hypothetical protein